MSMISKVYFLCLVSVVSIGLTACEADRPRRVVVSQQATSILIPPAVATSAEANAEVDYIVVQKADRVISLWKQGHIIKTYPILAFGADPYGTKSREGDEKTPEGIYYINDKHPSQHFQKFLNISYPNEEDKARAKQMGVPVGGNVGIHGDRGGVSGFFQRMNKNWTDGCIALRNADIEEIFAKVDVGTPIMIKP